MEEYKSNSHKAKEAMREKVPEKKIEKVITGTARTRKKNGIEKLARVFMPDDVQDVKSYILIDVLVPMIKDAAIDILKTLFYGESSLGRKGSAASKISYRNYYDRESDRKRNYSSSALRSRYGYDDIVLDSRGEAEEVLLRMDELIDSYGVASVADLYELVGKTGDFTHNKYGWTDIRSASVVRVRDGYLLKFPKAMPLD